MGEKETKDLAVKNHFSSTFVKIKYTAHAQYFHGAIASEFIGLFAMPQHRRDSRLVYLHSVQKGIARRVRPTEFDQTDRNDSRLV